MYAVLRVVPRVERGERFNAGLVLFCRPKRFLSARVWLDEAKLAALAPGSDPSVVRAHLDARPLIAAGDPAGGPIALLEPAERFHWLVAPGSTVIQPGPVHTGLTDDPRATFDRLFAELVADDNIG
jgi:hypothetical protein